MSKKTTFSPKPDDIDIVFSPGGWTSECNYTYYETTSWTMQLTDIEEYELFVSYKEYEDNHWDIIMMMDYIPKPDSNIWENYVNVSIDSDESLNVHQTAHAASAIARESLIDKIAASPIKGAENFLRILNAWDIYLLNAWDDSWLGRVDEPRRDD